MIDQEIIDLVNGVIDMWEEDTCLLSSCPDHSHPAFTIIIKIADRWEGERKSLVISTILRRMQRKMTWFFVILYNIVSKEDQPKFTEDMRGKVKVYTKVWIDWGKEKGYLNEQPGPTGKFPNGRVNKYDEGELAVGVLIDREKNVLIIDFNKEIGWLGLTPVEAYELSRILFQKAKELEGDI